MSSLGSHLLFPSIEWFEALKQIVNDEPDLADGLLCSLGAKYQKFRKDRGDE